MKTKDEILKEVHQKYTGEKLGLVYSHTEATEAMEKYAEQFRIKILPSDCTCCGDQYGMATNPECIIHGDKR